MRVNWPVMTEALCLWEVSGRCTPVVLIHNHLSLLTLNAYMSDGLHHALHSIIGVPFTKVRPNRYPFPCLGNLTLLSV